MFIKTEENLYFWTSSSTVMLQLTCLMNDFPPPLLPSFGKNPKEKQLFFVKRSLTRASIILCLISWTILMIGRMVLLRAYKRGHFLYRRERPPQEDLCLLIFIRKRNCFNLMLSFVVKKERLY